MKNLFFLKLKYKLRSISGLITNLKGFQFKFSTQQVVLFLITITFTIFILRNIYASFNDISQFRILNKETERLNILKNENSDLNNAREYYQSDFFHKLYARESMNLAKENEELYYVERRDEYNYDNNIKEVEDPINTSNNREWWIKLLL